MENAPKPTEKIPATTFEEKKSNTKWTKRKILVLFMVVYGNLLLGSCYSLMAPFYPAEAEKKGASATAYGLVFGIYQLVNFLSSPIYGKFMPKLGPSFMMKAGMLVSGTCVILFGFLEYAEGKVAFIGLSLFIRIVDALGAAGFLTASYTTLGCELSDIMGRAMSITETAFALGLSFGPAIGGFLFELGGFPLPFFCVGAGLLAGRVLNCFIDTNVDKEISSQKLKVLDLLFDFDFQVDMIAITTCFAVIGFNEATLEPHIRLFDLKATTIGVIFLISGITDAIMSPIWGYFAEKMPNPQYLTVLGVVSIALCFLIVGPVRFLMFETNLTAVIISQFLLGLGMALVIVSCFTHGMQHFVKKGYPDEVGTYSMTSSVIFSSACFGAFAGPSIGGVLIDHFGYVKTTELVFGITILVGVVCTSRLVYQCVRKAKN